MVIDPRLGPQPAYRENPTANVTKGSMAVITNELLIDLYLKTGQPRVWRFGVNTYRAVIRLDRFSHEYLLQPPTPPIGRATLMGLPIEIDHTNPDALHLLSSTD